MWTWGTSRSFSDPSASTARPTLRAQTLRKRKKETETETKIFSSLGEGVTPPSEIDASVEERPPRSDGLYSARRTPEHESFVAFAGLSDFSDEQSLPFQWDGQLIPRLSVLGKTEATSQFLLDSTPVILTGALRQWPALSKWSFEFFAKHYPDSSVIANDRAPARKQDMVSGQPQRTVHCSVKEYVEYVRQCKEGLSASKPAAPFYLNGWHAFTSHPELLSDICYPGSQSLLEDHTPAVLEEIDKVLSRRGRGTADKLWAHNTDVLLNKVFVGPRGTITRLHFDAHHAHGWLAQVKGEKLFVLFPPSDSPKLNPLSGEQTTQSPIDPLRPDFTRYPECKSASLHYAIVKEGETIVIPEGWWHFAVALDDSITVMRNFYNAFTNVKGLVEVFAEGYKKVSVKR